MKQDAVNASDEIKIVAKSSQSASKDIQDWASKTTNSFSLIKALFSELEQLSNHIISSAKRGKNP